MSLDQEKWVTLIEILKNIEILLLEIKVYLGKELKKK
jgi:hypothetical protein